MKKKVLAALGGMAAAGVIGLGFAQSGIVNAGPNLSEDDVRTQVQEQYPGDIKELELDEKGNNHIYEVEIEIDGKEYELAIDGNNGDVLKLNEKAVANKKSDKAASTNDDSEKADKQEKDAADDKADNKEKEGQTTDELSMKSKDDNADDKDETKQSSANNQPAESSSKSDDQSKNSTTKPKKEEKKETKKAVIGESKANSIALGQYAGTVEEIELNEDDGRLKYEIEIKGSNGEAEIEIDAYTGAVIIVDIVTYENDDDDDDDGEDDDDD